MDQKMMSVGKDNKRQTDRQVYSSQKAHTHTKCSNKMGYMRKVLEIYVLNPKMMSVGEDNNRQTDRHMYSSKKAQT